MSKKILIGKSYEKVQVQRGQDRVGEKTAVNRTGFGGCGMDSSGSEWYQKQPTVNILVKFWVTQNKRDTIEHMNKNIIF